MKEPTHKNKDLEERLASVELATAEVEAKLLTQDVKSEEDGDKKLKQRKTGKGGFFRRFARYAVGGGKGGGNGSIDGGDASVKRD